MIPAIALVIAAFIPLGFLYAIRAMDFYQTGSMRFIAMSGIWGVIAYFLAARINTGFINAGIFNSNTVIRFIAPIVEETLKALILLYLIRQVDFKYFLDGAIYGFAAGIGFAIFENFEYVLGHPAAGLGLAISRVLSTNLIHASGSALIGIALGLARFDRSSLTRGLYLLGGWSLAIIIHSGFNNMVNDGVQLLFAFGAGLGSAAIIFSAVRRGLQEEKAWVYDEIGLTEGVTKNEATAVRRLKDVDSILSPLAERFGPEKASQIEKFLFMQAQLAIQNKMLSKLQDEKSRAAVRQDITTLNSKMNEIRKSVGTYCMLYLRNIFPENETQLWNLLQLRVTANKSDAGTGLWTTLTERTKTKPAPEQNN